MLALAIGWLVGTRPPAWAPPCPFHYLTGLHCPGCGSTRALLALLHGDIARAFRMNSLLVVALPLLGGWAAARVAKTLRGDPRPVALPQCSALVALVVLLLYFLLRNLPWWPCTLLAPHG